MRFLFSIGLVATVLLITACGGSATPTAIPAPAVVTAAATNLPAATSASAATSAPAATTAPPQTATPAGVVTATAAPAGTEVALAETPVVTVTATTEPGATEIPAAPVPPESKLIGSYSGILPAADAPGRIVSLELALDGTATMTTEFIGKGGPSTESGTWVEDNGQAVVTFAQKDGQPEDNRITWKLDGTKLTAVAYDQTQYGTAGVPLTVVGSRDVIEANYGGVSFSFDSTLAKSAQGVTLPAVPVQNEPALGGGAPPGIRFTFDNKQLPDYFDPKIPQVYVYPVDGLNALDPSVAQGVASLQKLLQDKPAEPKEDIFVFPLISAHQGMRVNVSYLDFVNGSGVRFVTYYTQDISPVTNSRIFYTFQGITLDGKWYVSMFYPVTTPALPDDKDAPDTSKDDAAQFEAYLNNVIATLDSLPPAGYMPNLRLLDNMAQSINAAPELPAPTPAAPAAAAATSEATETAVSEGTGTPQAQLTIVPPANAPAELQIIEPEAASAVTTTIHLQGQVTETPFDNQLSYRVIDQSGKVIGSGPVPVEGQAGQAGAFDTNIELKNPNAGPGRILVYAPSPQDGSMLYSAVVDVYLGMDAPPKSAPTSDILAARAILILAPKDGTIVGNPFPITGRVAVTPFENNLTYRAYDAKGELVGAGPIKVQGEQGKEGTFRGQIQVNPGVGGPGRVEVLDISAADGFVTDSAALNVTWGNGQSSGATTPQGAMAAPPAATPPATAGQGTPAPVTAAAATSAAGPRSTSATEIAGTGQQVTSSFNGVSIAFDSALAKSAEGVSIPAVPVDTNAPALGGGAPANTAFGFNGDKLTAEVNPFQAAVRVYPLDEIMAMDPAVAREVVALKTLLAVQVKDMNDTIPVFPPFNAQQMINPQIKYLPFKNGEGVRFVTFYAQNTAPVSNDGLFYTYQGLSSDGKHYVTVFYPLRTDKLPDTFEDAGIKDMDTWVKGYDKYLTDTEALLNGLQANQFSPDLTLIDQLAQSIQISQ